MAASDIQVNLLNSAGNVDILIDGKKGIEHNFDKELIILGVPNKGNSGTLTYLIDLQKLKEVITVNGYLEDTTATSALAKKTTLRTILRTSGSATLGWWAGAKAQSYNGNIVKGSIKELSGKIGDEGSQGKKFDIMLQFAIGTHRG